MSQKQEDANRPEAVKRLNKKGCQRELKSCGLHGE